MFSFPVDADIIVSKLSAKFGEIEIETKVE
jgi:hypothetical protein